MKRILLILIVFCLAPAVECAAQTSVNDLMAVRAGHLFDSKSGKMLDNQVILIRGDKITEVGSAETVQIPPGAQVIDLS